MDDREDDRDAILRRRNRFIALALSGLTSTAIACSDSHGPADASTPPTGTDAGVDAAPPEVCLSIALDAGEPMPCLEPPHDAGDADAGTDAAEPMPCLTPKP